MASCDLGNPTCSYNPGTGRHRHLARDLMQIGQKCACGVNMWVILFGGPLPARVVCGTCGEGFNIGERLRTCGQPKAPRTVRQVQA